MSDRKWLNCRLLDIQERLDKRGHGVSLPVISRLLRKNDYSLKANAKQKESKPHPDRDQQFEHIRDQRAEHQARGQPVISVDTKKKELVGDFRLAPTGQESRPDLVSSARAGQYPRFPP